MSDTTEFRHAILARIEERLKAVGLNRTRACVAAGVHLNAINNINKSMPATDLFEKLAPVLDTTPGYLAYGENGPEDGEILTPPPAAYAGSLVLRGEVAAGKWLEIEANDAPTYPTTPIPAHPLYDTAAQFAVMVRGTSINRRAEDGTILSCVDPRMDARARPKDGDLVIVERRRYGGQMVEHTAKVLKGDGKELWPDSTDPKWQEPLDLSDGADDSTEAEIIGTVIWILQPTRKAMGGDQENSTNLS